MGKRKAQKAARETPEKQVEEKVETPLGDAQEKLVDFDDMLNAIPFQENYEFDTSARTESRIPVDTAFIEQEVLDIVKEVEQELEAVAQEEVKQKKTSGIYSLIADFGAVILRGARRTFRVLGRALRYPVQMLWNGIRTLAIAIDLYALKSLHAFTAEIRVFGGEIRKAGGYLKRAKNPITFFSVMGHYMKKAYQRHKRVFRTVFNTALPVAAAAVFLLVVNYWGDKTFALEVKYNNKSIGYITDESVYMEAETLARQQIVDDDAQDSGLIETPQYAIKLVTLNQLNDAPTICDRLIESSDQNLTNACGIYIKSEGDAEPKFICSVKNRIDAENAFEAVLAPYKTGKENESVGFVEEISYQEGLYPDQEETMWDAATLMQTLQGDKEGEKRYTVRAGDNAYDIAVAHGMLEEELLRVNGQDPEKDWVVYPGDSILTSNRVSFITVKTVRTEQRSVEVNYETEKVKDGTMFQGDSKTLREGVKGEERITELVTYVNGKKISTEEISRTTIKEPIKKRVAIGTKSTKVQASDGSGATYNYSSKGFIWPARGCYRVSSYYGYRSSGFHSGVDLVSSSSGSTSGSIVVASRDGVVTKAGNYNDGYGQCVVINHGDGYSTLYAHMITGSIGVSVGQRVSAGQAVGRVGSTGYSTGPHLHFEVRYNNQTQNPLSYIQ